MRGRKIASDSDLVSEYELTLVAANGSSVRGTLRIDERTDTVSLEYSGYRFEERDECYFDAFCRIREKLEEEGLRPICYGASRNVYPSGMSCQMGGGIRAFKLTLGQPSRLIDLVNIFDTGLDIEPVSVGEQRKFHQCWVESLR